MSIFSIGQMIKTTAKNMSSADQDKRKFINLKDNIMKEWWIRTFKVIRKEDAEKRCLSFVGNVYGDEINRLNCRSIWRDSKMRRYRVAELG